MDCRPRPAQRHSRAKFLSLYTSSRSCATLSLTCPSWLAPAGQDACATSAPSRHGTGGTGSMFGAFLFHNHRWPNVAMGSTHHLRPRPRTTLATGQAGRRRPSSPSDTAPPGHVSITPSDLALISEWAATRGIETAYQFTHNGMNAIIGVVRRPK